LKPPFNQFNAIFFKGQVEVRGSAHPPDERDVQSVPGVHQLRHQGGVLLRKAEPARLAGNLHRVKSRSAHQAPGVDQVATSSSF
jgi:hypothetical protein